MSELIPAILANSKQEFEEKLRVAEKFSSTVQIDILDGSLLPISNWHDAEAVSALAKSNFISKPPWPLLLTILK